MKHFKGEPTRYIIKYAGGKIKKKGLGLSFYYMGYNTSIISIPATTIDSNFFFNETTKNYQSVSLQGHFTYKIQDPLIMDSLLNFQIDPKTRQYLSEDPEKLEFRIKNVVQMFTRNEITKMNLEDALSVNSALANSIIANVKEASLINEMGIEILSISFNAIKPTPEIAKALEADYRESLQRKSDVAIYARRAAAVEQEGKIRENELNTQITLEEKKEQLIRLKGDNIIKEAEFNSMAKNLELEPFKQLDPRLILALSLKELSGNAQKIGNLTITSDILSSILN
jgi:regulator of protease activity HflC (stomatin/prohibitin superfamily)